MILEEETYRRKIEHEKFIIENVERVMKHKHMIKEPRYRFFGSYRCPYCNSKLISESCSEEGIDYIYTKCPKCEYEYATQYGSDD